MAPGEKVPLSPNRTFGARRERWGNQMESTTPRYGLTGNFGRLLIFRA
jgi:hypothetical protein